MKIGIISDSHNSRKNVLKAVEIFNQRKVSCVFHAGDIVSPATAMMFAELRDAKFIAVFGNCDSDRFLLKGSIESFGGEIHPCPYTIELAGRRIFITHQPNQLKSIVADGRFDLVIYGHTHKPDIRKIGDTLLINPGRSTGRLIGEPHVVVLDLDDMTPEQISLKY